MSAPHCAFVPWRRLLAACRSPFRLVPATEALLPTSWNVSPAYVRLQHLAGELSRSRYKNGCLAAVDGMALGFGTIRLKRTTGTMGCNLSTAWLRRKRAPAKEAAENTAPNIASPPDPEPASIAAQKTAPTSRPLAAVPEQDSKPPVQPASAHQRKKPLRASVTSGQPARSTYSPPSQSYHPTSTYVPTYGYSVDSGGHCGYGGGGNSSSGGGDSSGGGGCTSSGGGDSSGGGGCSSC